MKCRSRLVWVFYSVLLFFIYGAISCTRHTEQQSTQEILELRALSDGAKLEEKFPEKVIITIEKSLLYDKYTLEDSYPYRDTVRGFQWDTIKYII